MIWQLDENEVWFPDPHLGDDDGLIAVGGDLSVNRLLTAYCHGIFPWYGFRESPEILWWCPLQRFVIFPKEIHVSHTMRQMIRRKVYDVTFNEAFDDVIRGCSKAQDRISEKGAWLGENIIMAYTQLNRLGYAASVEVWQTGDDGERKLVGGLYGVNIGRHFFGESMFSLAPSASKMALISLARYMEQDGGIIDCQLETSHLKSMGGRYISYDEYMEIISQ